MMTADFNVTGYDLPTMRAQAIEYLTQLSGEDRMTWRVDIAFTVQSESYQKGPHMWNGRVTATMVESDTGPVPWSETP